MSEAIMIATGSLFPSRFIMKSVFLALALVLGVAVGLLIGRERWRTEPVKAVVDPQAEIERAFKSEIQRVFYERISAATNNVRIVKRRFVLNYPKTIARLHTINISNCPPDFRVAWVDYLYVLQINKLNSGDRFISGLSDIFAHHDPFAPEKEDIESENKLHDAWHKCVLIGVKFGAYSQ